RPGWEVCAEARNGREAVKMAETTQPDVVVMDISMPELNGLEAARRIRKQLPRTEVAILSLHFSDQLVHDILDSGARAYIRKPDPARDLVSPVESLPPRRPFFTPKAVEMAQTASRKRKGPAEPLPEFRGRLTPREREIVQLLAEGKSSKEVAVALNI